MAHKIKLTFVLNSVGLAIGVHHRLCSPLVVL